MSSACVSVEDAITTARIASSPSAASTERTSARYLEASSTAASRSTSTTYLSLARARSRAMLAAWIVPMRPAPNNATSIMVPPLSALEHPLVSRIVLEMPFALRSGHHIEIVGSVAVRHDDRMIAPWNHDDVVILDGERLVQVAIVGVDALEGEALRRIEPVIIGFLERALDWEIVGVVLVRRITGRVAAGRDDLHHQQMIRWLRLRKNVTDKTLIEPFSARKALHRRRLDQPRRDMAAAGGAGNADIGVGERNDAEELRTS